MSIATNQRAQPAVPERPTDTAHAAARPDWLAIACALLSLILLFGWIYGRFANKLYFVLDDYIETEAALAQPLLAVIGDFFSGALTWSGYRPVAYSTRAALAHLFGIKDLTGYYLFSLGLHFVNTLLTFHLVWRVARNAAWAYLAAAFVLLLPAHNEAILYMSASANVLALFFALLTLELALAARRRHRLWLQVGAGVTYLLAVLTYEVTLPLLALILLADWRMDRAFPRKRLPMYAALTVAAVVALGLRFWAGSGSFAPERADYGISLAPDHLLRGYTLLLSQMTLLFNSPWIHLPDFVWTREWMSPTNPRALVSMGMTFILSAVTLALGLRGARRDGQTGRDGQMRDALFWLGWGVLWVLLISLPFAALAGRNPENRYTYIPAFGAGIAFAAFFAWAWHVLARRTANTGNTARRWAGQSAGQLALLAVPLCLLTFYAWVNTSDVSEWERAAIHARSFLTAAQVASPAPGDARVLAQVGVPGDVGSAYVFTTDESFRAAIRLHSGGAVEESVAGDLALRELILDAPDATPATLLLGYNRETAMARRVANAWLCASATDPSQCAMYSFAASDPAAAPAPWLYIQVYNEAEPEAGGLGMLFDSAADANAVSSADGALLSCWMFYDVERVSIDPAAFDNAARAQRCQQSAAALAPLLDSTLLPD